MKYETTDGETQLIDTSIVSNGVLNNLFQGYQYKNKANSFTAEFSTSAEKGIRLTSAGNTITMAPVVTAAASVMTNNSTAAITAAVEETAIDDAFVYENAFGAGTRIKYYNTSIGIKEDIILDQNIGKSRFDFEINTNGDAPVLTEDAAMIFVYDKDDPEQLNYRFGTLYAYDSYTGGASESGFRHLTEECYYELTDLGDSKYRITVVVSAEWLNHPELVYPVTIDPSMTIANTATNIDDTYVRESNPTDNYYLENRLRIGNYNGTSFTDKKCYTYLRYISLPSLPAYNEITNASLTMYFRPNQTTAQPAAIWQVTSSWTGSSLTWNNKPGYTNKSEEIAQPQASGTTYDKYLFDVSFIVSRWYDTSANNGFMIAYNDETAQDLNSLYSSDCGVDGKLPTLSITYAELIAIPNGVYYIRNQNSGKYIDVSGQNPSSGANIHQWSFHGGLSQQWQLTNVGDRWYTIRPQHAPTMAMTVYQAGISNGVNIGQYVFNDWNAQKFGFVQLDNGAYRIVTKVNFGTKGISVNGRYTTNGANIHQYAYDSRYTNDHWYLEKALSNTKKLFTDSNINKSPNYNRTAVVNYANQYGESRNPNYISYSADCTNFISQCLLTGGFPFFGAPTSTTDATNDRQSNISYWFYTPEYNGLLNKNGISNTWAGATASLQHWGHNNDILGRGYQYIQYETVEKLNADFATLAIMLKPGDLFYQISNQSTANHAMIITSVSANDILYAQHTDDKINCSLKDLISRYNGTVDDFAFVRLTK